MVVPYGNGPSRDCTGDAWAQWTRGVALIGNLLYAHGWSSPQAVPLGTTVVSRFEKTNQGKEKNDHCCPAAANQAQYQTKHNLGWANQPSRRKNRAQPGNAAKHPKAQPTFEPAHGAGKKSEVLNLGGP